ncbi:MAG: SufD family Fe-S cluster assembly protein, partial [Muribaculaceae bacterium]|nr:SufD family Fe-S cluster assembly protein [Muribaculaceae bacterium]
MEQSLRQYVELYEHHRTAICEHSPSVLNSKRDKALYALREMKLPRVGSENYEITSLSELLGRDYGININRLAMDVNPAESFRCGVPRMSTALFMMINDRFAMTPISANGLPAGVTVSSFSGLGKEEMQEVAPYYGSLASISNPIVALNTLLAQDGIVIHVGRNVKVENPLQIVNILNAAVAMMVVRRVLIVLEEGAEVQILACDHTQTDEVDLMSLQTIEISVGRGACLEYYDMEESGKRTVRLSALYLEQQAESRVTVNGITLYNGTTRNEYHCRFAGEHAELSLCGMGIEDCDRHVDTYSYVEHKAGHCHTDELFKYVLDDRSRGAFTGM